MQRPIQQHASNWDETSASPSQWNRRIGQWGRLTNKTATGYESVEDSPTNHLSRAAAWLDSLCEDELAIEEHRHEVVATTTPATPLASDAHVGLSSSSAATTIAASNSRWLACRLVRETHFVLLPSQRWRRAMGVRNGCCGSRSAWLAIEERRHEAVGMTPNGESFSG